MIEGIPTTTRHILGDRLWLVSNRPLLVGTLLSAEGTQTTLIRKVLDESALLRYEG
jgi:hypothetical protein